VLPNPKAVDDTVIAVAMAALLFVLPSGEPGTRLLGDDWPKRVPWGVLVLLGSGFTLAAAVESSGLAAWLAERLGQLGTMPPLVLVLAITALMVLLTEFTVNSAITALMMPVLAATAVGLHVDPRLLMIPATLGASFGFMMPGGTAPNAMVFASGHITVAQMVRAGIGVDLIGILVITSVFYAIGLSVFGIATSGAPAWVH
jgi:sodium-dependent dicarboxylate transporter 2/3/5